MPLSLWTSCSVRQQHADEDRHHAGAVSGRDRAKAEEEVYRIVRRLTLVLANTISAIYGLLLVGLSNGRFHYRRHGVTLAEPAKYHRRKLILVLAERDDLLDDLPN